jgi:hypothetical protein
MGHLITLFQKPKGILRDSFNRADNALTMGNANTGQAWIPGMSTWGISSNQAYSIDTAGTDMISIETGVSNFSVSATVKFSVNEGIIFRYADANNHLVLRINSTTLGLVKGVASVFTSIGSYSFTPVVGTLYNIKAVCNGSSIQVFLDGVLRITATETANQTATQSGLRTAISTAGRFDNFLVEAL